MWSKRTDGFDDVIILTNMVVACRIRHSEHLKIYWYGQQLVDDFAYGIVYTHCFQMVIFRDIVGKDVLRYEQIIFRTKAFRNARKNFRDFFFLFLDSDSM